MARKYSKALYGKSGRRRWVEELVLESKQSARRKPIEWFEDQDGDLQPVFAEYVYTKLDLEPYRPYYRLYQEKKQVLKLVVVLNEGM
jgi:hypothetical protein